MKYVEMILLFLIWLEVSGQGKFLRAYIRQRRGVVWSWIALLYIGWLLGGILK